MYAPCTVQKCSTEAATVALAFQMLSFDVGSKQASTEAWSRETARSPKTIDLIYGQQGSSDRLGAAKLPPIGGAPPDVSTERDSFSSFPTQHEYIERHRSIKGFALNFGIQTERHACTSATVPTTPAYVPLMPQSISGRKTYRVFLIRYVQIDHRMGDILKFLSGKPSDTPAASSSTSNAAATAHRPTITSRLSSLTSKPPAPKPSDDRVSASILALQVFKTSKRAGGKGRSAAAGEDVIGVLDDDDDDNCRGNTTDRSSTGSRRARKRPRSSGLDAGSAARASSSAFPRTLSPASSGSSRPTTAASSINGFDFPPAESQGTGRGSPSSNSYRNNRFIANGKDHSEGGSKAGYRRDSSGGNTNGVMVAARKMGPWIKRKRERAVCEEDDYDPLELMRDANQDIFGNDAFRGVQEDVRRLLEGNMRRGGPSSDDSEKCVLFQLWFCWQTCIKHSHFWNVLLRTRLFRCARCRHASRDIGGVDF